MLYRLNFVWRQFATGFSFVVFGLGGLFMGTLVFPLVSVVSPNADLRRRRLRGLISLTFTFFFWMMHHLGIFRYRVIGRHLIKNDKSCLVIANHPSLIDIISLISLYPHACCIVNRNLWQNVFVRNVVKGAGYIPNDDPETVLEMSAEALERGDVLIIFPEGTRTVPGQKPQLHRGAAHVALRLRCPIRFVRIDVNPPTLTKGRPWYAIPPRRADFTLEVKSYLSSNEYPAPEVPLSLGSRQLTRKILENIDK